MPSGARCRTALKVRGLVENFDLRRAVETLVKGWKESTVVPWTLSQDCSDSCNLHRHNVYRSRSGRKLFRGRRERQPADYKCKNQYHEPTVQDQLNHSEHQSPKGNAGEFLHLPRPSVQNQDPAHIRLANLTTHTLTNLANLTVTFDRR